MGELENVKGKIAMQKRIFKLDDKNKLLDCEVLITVREAADILRCHRAQIYEYVQADYLTAHCPNGPGTRPMHIRTASVKQFIDNYSVGGSFSIIKRRKESE
jgi:hypothetical protein